MNNCDTEHYSAEMKRIHFLDNLRTFLIFLVIVIHAGGVYESSGVWASFWIVVDPATNNMSGLLFLILDIFTMPTIFFISGFFAYSSVKKKSGWVFIKSKFKRLLIPWIVASLTLLPLYKVIFLYSRNLPQESWTTYFHWSNGIWSQNWLWFLPVLFLFDILYMFFYKSKLRFPNISLRVALLAAFLFGFVYSFGMDILGLQGWTKTVLLDFQNERLLIYSLAFLMGALCFKVKVFDSKPKGRMLFYIVNATSWIPVTVYITFLLYPWVKPGKFIGPEIIHRMILWSSFHISLLCLAYSTIETFRRYLNKTGKLRTELNKDSYNVYIIHVIVIGILALILLNTPIPSTMKHLILTALTFGVSNLLVYCCRKLMRTAMLVKSQRLQNNPIAATE